VARLNGTTPAPSTWPRTPTAGNRRVRHAEFAVHPRFDPVSCPFELRIAFGLLGRGGEWKLDDASDEFPFPLNAGKQGGRTAPGARFPTTMRKPDEAEPLVAT
jgi:hypothetical protein